MLGVGVHAGLPGVLGHPRQGEEQESQAAEEEEAEGRAGAGEGPGVIVLDPDSVLAVDHALHRLPCDLHRDEDAETWGQSWTQGPGRPPPRVSWGFRVGFKVETPPGERRGHETAPRPRSRSGSCRSAPFRPFFP